MKGTKKEQNSVNCEFHIPTRLATSGNNKTTPLQCPQRYPHPVKYPAPSTLPRQDPPSQTKPNSETTSKFHTVPSTSPKPAKPPIAPSASVGHNPKGALKLASPLNGTYDVWPGRLPFAYAPPVPPPVRFAPFGWSEGL